MNRLATTLTPLANMKHWGKGYQMALTDVLKLLVSSWTGVRRLTWLSTKVTKSNAKGRKRVF